MQRKLQNGYSLVGGDESVTPSWKEQLLALPHKGKNIINGWRKLSTQQKLQLVERPGVIPGVISLVCLSIALQLTNHCQVVIDGQVLGAVKNKQAIVRYVQELDMASKEAFGSEVSLISDLRLARSFGLPAQDPADLQIILQDRLRWGTQAAVISVNGQEVVVLKDLVTAQSIIDGIRQGIKQQLTRQFSSVKQLSAGLVEKVEVVVKAVTIDRVVDAETAKEILLQGKSRLTQHVVSRGDTLSGIAVSRGVSVSELTKANPDAKPTGLKVGQALSLSVPEPYIHLKATDEVVETKPIPYPTRYVKDGSMWNWQSQAVTPGKDGVQEITTTVMTMNGQVTEQKLLSIKRISEPIEAVVKQGTKKTAVQGTGNFIWPTYGNLTSGYGWRWGKVHQAIDIGAAEGTPIMAADSGAVVFAGYKGSYGYLVEIDHGNGFVTYYAHCSKLLVSKGQKVGKGQTIAKVGHTGNATGSHVHFEIIKNGRSVNPQNYFK